MNYKIVIALSIILSSCLKSDPTLNEFVSFEPQDIGDGHTISSPSSESVDSAGLVSIYQDIYNDENLWSIRSFLVFRNGHLIAENYYQGSSFREEPQMVWSTTKQIVGLLYGIALNQGVVDSLDAPISNYFSNLVQNHPDKESITIRHLITMNSGIDYNNDGVGGETDQLLREIPENMIDFILNRPMRVQPGVEFHYNDGDPHLLSGVIQNQLGIPMDQWADTALFQKIGFTNYEWDRYKDGTTFGGYGLITTPRELGKIGLLVLNNGMWGGQQLVPSSYISEMLQTQMVVDGDFNFGYYWWLDEVNNIQFTWGHGGQFTFVIPDKNLVIVSTAIPNTQGKYQIQANEILPYVLRVKSIAN